MAGWGQDAPAEARNALTVLLSKLRHSLGADRLRAASSEVVYEFFAGERRGVVTETATA
jgi:hypothetical protein